MQSFFLFSVHPLSPSDESENPKFNMKDNLNVQGVTGSSPFEEGVWGFEPHCSKNYKQRSHLLYALCKATHHNPRGRSSFTRSPPSLASSWENSTDNIHGVTTTGVQASFVHYMNKWVLLFPLIFHAARPIRSCSLIPQYASVFHNPHTFFSG